MNTHLMLDIETLDTENTACILSVGGVLFDPEKGVNSYETVLDMRLSAEAQQKDFRRTISASTVTWWMQQSEAAREEVFNPVAPPTRLCVAATNLETALNRAEHIWANDPDFDCAVLKHFMQQHIPSFRWPFWKHRSYRTIKAFIPSLMIEAFDIKKYERGVAHNALDDAITQANVVCALWPYFTAVRHG